MSIYDRYKVHVDPKQTLHMLSTWIHIDINSYFATLLQQEIPSLRGKPLGVVKDHGRTCLIATSKEAKTFGVKTGMPLKDAKHLCPQIVVLPTFFPMYLSSTKKLKALFESISPDVNVFSMDEVFIYYTPIRSLYQSPAALAQEIQLKIKAALGEWVTCNIGIAETKFLAKMAGEVAKPATITQVTDSRFMMHEDTSYTPDSTFNQTKYKVPSTNKIDKVNLLSTTTFKDVCGIGYRLGAKLEALGIYTPYGINFLDDETLEKHFGSFWVKELRKMAQGEEPHFLSKPPTNEHMKSVSRSITCAKKTWADEQSIKKLLYNLTYEAMTKARKMHLAGRSVYLSFRGHDQRWSTHITLGHYVFHTQELFSIIYEKLYQEWQNHFAVVKCTVAMGMLQPWEKLELQYFPDFETTEKLESAMQSINERYGAFTIRSGLLTTRHEIIWPEVNGFFGDKDYYLNDY